MAHISQERMIEMEAEMDRFEQEILTPHSASDLPRVIIGSRTYNQVSAQLKKLRETAGSASSSDAERDLKAREVAAQLKLLRAQTENAADDAEDLLRPPPPPPPVAKSEDIPFLPPPPPPPPVLSSPSPSMSFIPPQLRQHRPPPPPPRPMMGPPRMRPPPPPRPPFGGPPMGPAPGPMGNPGGPGPGPMGPGPGPFPGPPRPGFGPRGPPFRPPMHPMGPDFMEGPQEPGGSGMYGVSSGESHKNVEEEGKKDPEDDKPKVVYSSAPQIVVPLEKKEKKRKRKKKDKNADTNSDKANSAKSTADSGVPEVVAAKAANIPESTLEIPNPYTGKVELQEDFQVADMEIEPVVPAKREKKEKKKKFIRFAAGQAWEDTTLSEWDQDDFRLFCGDLGNEVTDETLSRAFSKYPTFTRAKVVRDKRSQKTKGYGFVSFKDPNDYVRAIREMNEVINLTSTDQKALDHKVPCRNGFHSMAWNFKPQGPYSGRDRG